MSMNRDTDVLLQSGIAAVRSGDKREGARLLAQVVRKEPQSEDAWFWLAAATDQPAEAAACLRRVLAINPNNARARQALNMLDTGQGQAAFSTGPLDVEQSAESANRPLSTGDLIQPYSTTPPPPPVPAPPPPPPPFGNGNPYGDEPTIASANPYGTGPLNAAPNNPYGTGPLNAPPDPYGNEPTAPTPPPFAWTPNNPGEMPADPYSANPNTAPTQPNLPPPPPFIGGSGVRLGQLDPNAPPVPVNSNIAGPNVYDPGAELRASLLPPTPINAIPPPPGQVVVVKKKRRFSPLLLVLLTIIVLLLVGLIAFLLLRPANNSTPVADVQAAGQTATAAIALTATSTAQGTPGAAGNGTPGVNGTGAANGTPGVNGTGAANGTPGINGNANGTPGVGAGNGTPGNAANGTPGVGAGTVQPGQPTPTGQAGGQTGTTTGTGNGTNSTPGATSNGGTGNELPNGGTPGAGTPGAGTPGVGTPTVAAGLGTENPPTPGRDGSPPPEVVDYLNSTAKYINTAYFFEEAVNQGIVIPFENGRIKPGVTLINLEPFTIPISTTQASGPVSATNVTTPRANPTPTPNPSATVSNQPTQPPAEGVVINTPAPTGPAGTTPTVQPSAANGTVPTVSNIASTLPPYAKKVIVNGPNGPEEAYLISFSGRTEMGELTLNIGRVARVLKDQPVPNGAYVLNQVALEYANDLSNMANALDMFFQTGQLTYLTDVKNYYDKGVHDRERWDEMRKNGYPYKIIF